MDVVYVLINTSLNMKPGKVAAQAVHAALNLVSVVSREEKNNPFDNWHLNNPNSIIILDGRNEKVMMDLEEYLITSNLPSRFFDYQDEGEKFAKTALACGPFPKGHTAIEAVFKQFELYHDIDSELEIKYLRSSIANSFKTEATLGHIRALLLDKHGASKRKLRQILDEIEKDLNETYTTPEGEI